MTQRDAHGMPIRPLTSFASSSAWFRQQIRENGVTLHGRSALAVSLHQLETFGRDVVVDGHFWFNSTDEAYDFNAAVYGADFLTKAVHWGHSKGLRLPKGRWPLLSESDPLITRRTDSSEKSRNETWETVIASIAATFANDVRFGEPDVTCLYDGRRYAVAAKVAYSRDNRIANIENGVRQARTKADAVLVFIDVVSIYPQVETLRWSYTRKFQHNDERPRKP